MVRFCEEKYMRRSPGGRVNPDLEEDATVVGCQYFMKFLWGGGFSEIKNTA